MRSFVCVKTLAPISWNVKFCKIWSKSTTRFLVLRLSQMTSAFWLQDNSPYYAESNEWPSLFAWPLPGLSTEWQSTSALMTSKCPQMTRLEISRYDGEVVGSDGVCLLTENWHVPGWVLALYTWHSERQDDNLNAVIHSLIIARRI